MKPKICLHLGLEDGNPVALIHMSNDIPVEVVLPDGQVVDLGEGELKMQFVPTSNLGDSHSVSPN